MEAVGTEQLPLFTMAFSEPDNTAHKIVIRSDAGELVFEAADCTQDKIVPELGCPIIRRNMQVLHENEGTKNLGLILGRPADERVQRGDNPLEGVEA